jgi:hypothetical protein
MLQFIIEAPAGGSRNEDLHPPFLSLKFAPTNHLQYHTDSIHPSHLFWALEGGI